MPYKDPEKQKAAQAAIYQRNKEAYLERHKAWKLANPDKLAAQRRRYRKKYPEKMRERSNKYRQQHPEKVKTRRLRHDYGEFAECRKIYNLLIEAIKEKKKEISDEKETKTKKTER